MYQLSKLMRRYQKTRLLHGIVEYLETIDIPGPAKKALAVAIVKTLYNKEGGKWEKELERAVEGAIEFVLAEIREYARDWDERDEVPVPLEQLVPPVSNYGIFTAGELPDDGALLDMGFHEGDQKWTTKNGAEWTVTNAGGALNAAEYNFVGLIGG